MSPELPASMASRGFLPTHDADIGQVQRTAELRSLGYTPHYIVDTHDILYFCFPFYRGNKVRPHIVNAYILVALYEVLYRHDQQPIIMDEYSNELLSAASAVFERAQQAESLAASFRNVQSIENLDVGRDFVFLLAGALPLFRSGFEQFRDLVKHRLIKDVGDDVQDVSERERLRALFDDNRATSSGTELALALYRAIRLEQRGERDTLLSSCFVDATAVDRLAAVNRAASRQATGRHGDPHVFYYVSSARRSRTLFGIMQERGLLPAVEGEPLWFWRTPQQLLLEMVTADLSPEERARQLDTIRAVVADTGNKRSRIDARASAEYLEMLRRYQDQIASHFERIRNYGLLLRFEEYETSFSSLRAHGPTDALHTHARELLAKIYATQDPARMATKLRMDVVLAGARAALRAAVIKSLARLGGDRPHVTRKGSDAVAGSAQHLPTVFSVREEDLGRELFSLLRKIQAYFKIPVHGSRGGEGHIRDVCTAFMSIDTGASTEMRFDLELIRCLLFLSLPTPAADGYAFDHALELCAAVQSGDAHGDDAGSRDRYLRDFTYIACWSARRQVQLIRAEALANRAIATWPTDARFWHARCLITFAWLQAARDGIRERVPPGDEVTLMRAVADAERAVALYSAEWGDGVSDEIGAVLNTAAFLCASDLKIVDANGWREEVDEDDVRKAREYLGRLRAQVPKELWYERYPEYLHTEAYVEFREYRCLNRAKAPPSAMRRKLEFAFSDIDFASQMYGGDGSVEQDSAWGEGERGRREIARLRLQIYSAMRELQAGE